MTISKEHDIQREDDEPPGFTERRLAALEDKISHPRWVVPVLPEQELEILLVAATKMAIAGEDVKNPLCQRFYSDSLGVSFTKVLTDEAVSTWKTNIQLCVRSNCERLVRLCALKMDDARFLHLLAMLFNPSNKFHSFNSNRHSEPPLVIDMDLDEPLTNQIAIDEKSVTDKPDESTEQEETGNVEPVAPPAPEVYARCPDQRSPKGWLVDIINVFGTHHGFHRLKERLELVIAGQLPPPPPLVCTSPQPGTSGEYSNKQAGEGDRLSAKSPVGDRQGHSLEQANSLERPTPSPTDQLASLDPPSGEADEMAASTSSCCSRRQARQNTPTPSDSAVTAAWQLLRPFGLCHELLAPDTIVRYIQPLIEYVPTLLDRLTDEELKREARGSENKTDTVSCLIRACKSLAQRIPNHQELTRGLEMFRLKMILRLLQMSSFNGRMSALNEINQLIGSVTQQPRPEWLTSAVIATWIRENDVLEIVLRESLHQPQYVERLEKMLRFMIKEGALRLSDLDAIWRAQLGKHEAIVKNLHDLLAKLAWDFTPDQLDHLFDCFKASWSTSSKKQSDKLLEVIRRLAEDDKDGVMAHKVLVLFWNLAHAPDICNEVMDVALSNHVKILDYSCSNDRDAQKAYWLNKCVEEMKSSENWVLPALKQIREICCLYEISGSMAGGHVPAVNLPDALPANTRPSGSGLAPLYRQEVIDKLQDTHSLVIQVTDSLTDYMERARNVAKQTPNLDFDTWLPDGRYPHSAQVHERLSFLRFLLKDGQLWLCAEQAKQIWVCLAEQGVVGGDREACFRWFSKLMGEEPDLDPGISLHFFRQNIMTLEPRLLTFSGIKCFERFFKAVNCKEGKLIIQRRNFFIDDADLIGLDYLWRVITECNDEISARGVELLREVCTNVGPRLSASIHHENFLMGCCSRLERLQRNLGAAEGDEEINAVCIRMFRVLRAVQEYVNECDKRFSADRHILPMYRAGRGRHCSLVVRFQAGQRQLDDMELYSHSNETLQGLKNTIQRRLKCGTGGRVKLDLYANGVILDSSHDRKLLAQIPIRDKMVLVGKVGGTVGNLSNDSSSDSSTGSPPPPMFAETSLPGVILSRGAWYIPFILELEHQGTVKNHSQLRDAAHMLTQSVPSHFLTVDKLLAALVSEDENILKQQLYGPSPCTVAYNVAVLYSMVMPALEPLGERSSIVQLACVRRVPMLIEALNDEAFLKGAAHHTWRLGYLYLMKLVKVVLTAWGHMYDMMLTEQRTSLQNSSSPRSTAADVLREALLAMPSQSSERMVKAVSEKLAKDTAEQMNGDANQVVLATLLSWQIPARMTVRMVCSIAMKAATYHTLVGLMLHPDDVTLVRECVEVVTLVVALGGGQLDKLLLDKEPWWQETVFELTVMSPNVLVRVSCAEQILAMCSWGRVTSTSLQSGDSVGRGGVRGAAAAWCLAMFLPQADSALVRQYCNNAQQFMQLLCRLVSLASGCGEDKLKTEVIWLRNCLAASREGREYDDTLLEGHLIIAKEMFLNSTPEVKFRYGSSSDSPEGGLVKELVCSFLWPSSWAQWELRGGGAETRARALSRPPVCRTPGAAAAACDLLAALSHTCHANMETLAVLLTNMFYDDASSVLMEWDYLPSVGPRSATGQVGLKNAGATCYMNSVLQQIYMVPAIREYLLTVQGAVTDPNEDFSGEDPLPHLLIDNNIENSGDYNVCILKQVQAIFTHLRYSKLQYYVPRGLWTHFKLQGEPVNVREQQDAVEFFMSLVESLDEALKTLGQEQYMAKILGGSFADQKICKGCPHRYCKEEPFSVVSLDIRNMSRLQESLEAYVRGELLEGADAYHCDKCNKKVVTVKRLCLNKLPPVLAIQLKRFEYDFDKVCAIKFNDYFEFPRELDVEPYTVRGLAKAEGEAALLEECGETGEPPETHYQLTGIVVHSGQASGGHYYSYILTRDTSGAGRWMKFDDGDVAECAMHDDEEMKAQCFGGEYMGEVLDPMLKRVSYRRQKRWWNAYMLFYTRRDQVHRDTELYQDFASLSIKESKVPRPIWECVQRGNIAFSHHQDQFSHEHFNFMKKLCCMRMQVAATGQNTIWGTDQEELSILSIQLATKFLFHVGFKTKKTLRGPISDWYDILCQHLRSSQTCRTWFALNAIFQNPARLGEYLFVCPSQDVRLVVTKLIVFLAHFSYNDAPVSWTCGWTWDTAPKNLAEQVMGTVLALAARPVDYGFQRNQLPPIFTLLHMYATRGVNERRLLAKLHAIQVLITVAVDDSVSSIVKHQYPEGVKIHQVIAAVVRSCDVLSRCQSSNSNAGVAPLPNPLSDPPPGTMSPGAEPRLELPVKCAEVLYNKNGYVKRLVEDCSSEEEIRIVQFLAWENPAWSRAVLAELLWQMAYAYCHELRRHSDTLLALLLLEDSWQAHRIHNAIKGVTDEREGLMETAVRSRGHYAKRAYACVRLLVSVMVRCPAAVRAVNDHPEERRRWRATLSWLQDELDRRFGSGGYTYNTWSPPNNSSENSSAYFLERSNSARKTIERAYELCPEEEEEDDEDESSECGDVMYQNTPMGPVPPGAEQAASGSEPALSVSQKHSGRASPVHVQSGDAAPETAVCYETLKQKLGECSTTAKQEDGQAVATKEENID